MSGETDLAKILKSVKPKLHGGNFVFCTTQDLTRIKESDVICIFKEEEGFTVITNQGLADELNLEYSFVAAWITLTVHSSLEAVGLTSAFSTALAREGISCNVVAAFYHDHIFVKKKDSEKAIDILNKLSL
jgi:uncharacterized protein